MIFNPFSFFWAFSKPFFLTLFVYGIDSVQIFKAEQIRTVTLYSIEHFQIFPSISVEHLPNCSTHNNPTFHIVLVRHIHVEHVGYV